MFTGEEEAGRKWQHGVPGRHLQLPGQIQWGRQTVQKVGHRAESHEHVHRPQDVWPGQGRLLFLFFLEGGFCLYSFYIFLSFFICTSKLVEKIDWSKLKFNDLPLFIDINNIWPNFTNILKWMQFSTHILIRHDMHMFVVKLQIWEWKSR